jgi:tetratricopeptide (TPR) repeat protein
MAEARVVCALMAAGPLWDMDAVRPALTAALADLAEQPGGGIPVHPIAAMAEPMLALYDHDPDRTLIVLDRYEASEDAWTRAAVPLQRGAFFGMFGRPEEAQSEVRAALAAFRELGEPWGIAVALVQLADFAALRGDNRTAITSLQEAAALGRELSAWGDLPHITGKLAAVRLRTGDLAAARADLEQAERDEGQRGAAPSDSAVWLGLVRAELHAREGDFAAAARQCEEVLGWLDRKPSKWWLGFRALTKARLALTLLPRGDEARCRALLADALRDAGEWVELPALAEVIDAIAALTVHASPLPADRAQLAATLLGAAHSIRGTFDEGSLDAPAVRDAGRGLLGAAGFESAYQRGRALPREEALALAASAVAQAPQPAPAAPPAR